LEAARLAFEEEKKKAEQELADKLAEAEAEKKKKKESAEVNFIFLFHLLFLCLVRMSKA
jgi:DNA-binding FadR family transcriptional regulator